MLIELQEGTWQEKRVKRIQSKFAKRYIKEINDRFYISLEDLFNLLGDVDDNYNFVEDKLIEFSNELDKGVNKDETE